jgi:tRNA (guanine37-N1)-methyltransferase
MQIHVLTIFPEMFPGPLRVGIVGRAIGAGIAGVAVHDIRAHAHDRHRTTDDSPFGGGPGMVMRPEPIFEAVEALSLPAGTPLVLLTPQGRTFRQADAERFASLPSLALLCGRYEGVDERVIQGLVTEELSVGDYVLTGGELPALTVVDAVIRLLPDSHTSGLLQYPQYTRPAEFRGVGVPEVLRSGDHAAIARWRRREALRRTLERRPDMLSGAALDASDIKMMREMGWEG